MVSPTSEINLSETFICKVEYPDEQCGALNDIVIVNNTTGEVICAVCDSVLGIKEEEEDVDGFAEKPAGCERFFRSGRTGEGAEQLSIEQRKRLANGLAEAMNRFQYEGPELVCTAH